MLAIKATGTVCVLVFSADNKAAVVKDILTQLHLVRDGCQEAEQVAVIRGRGEGWGGGGVTSGEIGELCEGVQEVKLGGGGEGPREWNEREAAGGVLCGPHQGQHTVEHCQVFFNSENMRM